MKGWDYMRRKLKVLLSVMIVMTLLVTSVCSVFASRNENGKGNQQNFKKQFKDVSEDFWGYQAIQQLTDLGIISGFPDNTFKPNERVTRFQFATLLIKALDLTTDSNTQTFADVPSTNSYYTYVEASSSYLTGWIRNGTLYFDGNKNAVREDMAVALVKALNITLSSDNGQLQQVFSDYNQISASLRDYVYTAYKAGIMVGSNGKFNPQGDLTRAEAATLLLKALQKSEKVPVDGGQKVPIDDSNSTDATLSNLTYNGATIPGFSSNTYAYNVILPAGTTAIPVVSAVVHDAGSAYATVTQAAALPGYATIVVIAKDGTTYKTYTVNFTIAGAQLHKDATLSSIAINGSALTGFVPGNTTYNVILQAGTTAIPVVTAAVHDTGKATTYVTQAAALPGHAIIVVVAEDGITLKTYTVNFTVAAPVKNTDATLSSLAINGVALTGFDPSVLTNNVLLTAGTTAIPVVTAVVHDTGKATAIVTQAAALPGHATIVVTAEDGITHKIHTVNFTVAPTVKSTDATLSGLLINGAALTGFTSDMFMYNVLLPAGTTAIPTVFPTVNNAKATVIITQATSLSGSATVLVTAEDGTTHKTYTVNFTVSAS